MVYVAAGSIEEAEHIATRTLEARLIACANILPGMRSIYRWQGRVEQAEEVVLILKTTEPCVLPLLALIQQLHSYDNPCSLVLDLSDGLPGFMSWIAAETIAPEA